MIAFPEHRDTLLPIHDLTLASTTEDHEDDEGSVVVLGKGSPENLIFDWIVTDWSKCSETCGGNGYQMRVAHCMVKLHNTTQNVDKNLCDDAGLLTPETYRKCGLSECPKWVVSEWSTCTNSKCFRLNTGNFVTIKFVSYCTVSFFKQCNEEK